jgi:D-glycero-D-manno-heptose 1,7-bisphosphate phosphatase
VTGIAIRAPHVDPQADALLAAASTPRRALLLDRDGVINMNHGYVHTPQRTEWVPGIFELVAHAHRQGMLAIVATNQAGIGRGYYSEEEFLAYTAWMHAQFAQRGTPLLATFWCPHHPDAGIGEYRVACACRKPAPGMLLDAIRVFDITPAISLMIGDKDSDLAAASAAGVPAKRVDESQWGMGMLALLAAA